MTVVRIAKNWETPDLLRQTPGGRGEWGGIRFTVDAAADAHYRVVPHYLPARREVGVAAERLWALIQEPPIPLYRAMHATTRPYARVYTQTAPPGGESVAGTLRLPSQPALPWHVERSYDELVAMEPPVKTLPLSAISSDLAALSGHRARLRFLAKVRDLPELDRFGRGVRPLADKWDGLAPYRYSLAIENASVPNYWTEKLADCFLAWTLPIYAGCPNLEEFCPAESFVRIDLDDPDAPRQVAEVARGRLWEERREAIAEARRRVLEEHQLFPFLAAEIRRHEAQCAQPERERIVVPGRLPTPLLLRPLANTQLRRLLARAVSRGYGVWLRVRR